MATDDLARWARLHTDSAGLSPASPAERIEMQRVITLPPAGSGAVSAMTGGVLRDGRTVVITGHPSGEIVVRDLTGTVLRGHQMPFSVARLRAERLPAVDSMFVVEDNAIGGTFLSRLDPLGADRSGGFTHWLAGPASAISSTTGEGALVAVIGYRAFPLYEASTGTRLGQLLLGRLPTARSAALATTHNDQVRLVVATDFDNLYVWELSAVDGRPTAVTVADRLPSGPAVALQAENAAELYFPDSGERFRVPLPGRAAHEPLAAIPTAGGMILATTGVNGDAVTLHRVPTGDVLASLSIPDGTTALAAIPLADGTHLLAVTDRTGTVHLWRPAALPPPASTDVILVGEFRVEGIPVELASAELQDGRLVALTTVNDARSVLYDERGTVRARMAMAPDQASTCVLPDGRDGLAVKEKVNVTFVDLVSGQVTNWTSAHHLTIVGQAATGRLDDGTHVVIHGSTVRSIDLVSLHGALPIRRIPRQGGLDLAMFLGRLADGRQVLIAAAGMDDLAVWDVATGTRIATLEHANTSAARLATLPGGRPGLVDCKRSGIRSWDLETGSGREFTAPASPSLSNSSGTVRFANDVAATRENESTVELWSLTTGRLIGQVHHPAQVISLATSTDQIRMLTIDMNRVARLWRFGTPTAGAPPEVVDVTVQTRDNVSTNHAGSGLVFVESDGRTLLVRSGRYAAAFDPATLRERWEAGPFPNNAGGFCAQQTSTGPILAITTSDGFYVVDARTGTVLRRPAPQSGTAFLGVAFDPRDDGATLFLGGHNSQHIRNRWRTDDITSTPFNATGLTRPQMHLTARHQISGDRLILGYGSAAGEVLVIDADTMETLLLQRVDFSALPSAASRTTTVLFVDDSDGRPVVIVVGGRQAHALNLDGTVRWSRDAVPANWDAFNPAGVVRHPGHGWLMCLVRSESEVDLMDPLDGTVLGTVSAPEVSRLTAVAIHAADQDHVTVAANGFSPANQPALAVWHVTLRHVAAQQDPTIVTDPDRIRQAARGVAAAASTGWWVPLGAVLEAVRLLDGLPATGAEGVRLLRGLRWPADARLGLAMLLLADLDAEPRLAPPPDSDPATLLKTLITHVRDAHGTPDPPTQPITPAPVGGELVELLQFIGPAAVAADPLLPLRLRDTPEIIAYDFPRHGRPGGAATKVGTVDGIEAGVDGVVRTGTLSRILPSELALPPELFRIRWLRGETLYRRIDTETPQALGDVTVVLDVSPATAGPVEGVLRAVAHALTVTLWASGGHPWLVTASQPETRIAVDTGVQLSGIWTVRSLDPANLTEAIPATGHTIVLTGWRAVTTGLIRPAPNVNIVTAHATGDPPRRRPTSPHHWHLGPDADTTAINAVAANVLTAERPVHR
ncbi:WD40 repeat domain-containing protein [Dactylosporangium siamense]|uniref:WD40 repeat domain-containing protein n=1 Tax=Dactylosporangium siamense TaxID=685454 RepID=A0A919UGS8_9ACTN|nr:hypothetical protein [Dactylosporangium siamense]GIG49993.1 hypothetical protein Dsi01nite_080340 [Dactylosporangium siamense]